MITKARLSKTYGMQEICYKRDDYSKISLPQKIRKVTNNQPNLFFKTIRGRRTSKTQSSIREGTIKIKAEISKIAMKKTITKLNDTKNWFFGKIKLINLQPDLSRKKGEDSNQ